MSCHFANKDMLSAYYDNELSVSDREKIMKHIGSCDECASELKIYSDISTAFSGSKVTVPQELISNVLNNINAQSTEHSLIPLTGADRRNAGRKAPAKLFVRYLPVAACLIAALLVWAFPGGMLESLAPNDAAYDGVRSMQSDDNGAYPESDLDGGAGNGVSSDDSAAVDNQDISAAPPADVSPRDSSENFERRPAAADMPWELLPESIYTNPPVTVEGYSIKESLDNASYWVIISGDFPFYLYEYEQEALDSPLFRQNVQVVSSDEIPLLLDLLSEGSEVSIYSNYTYLAVLNSSNIHNPYAVLIYTAVLPY